MLLITSNSVAKLIVNRKFWRWIWRWNSTRNTALCAIFLNESHPHILASVLSVYHQFWRWNYSHEENKNVLMQCIYFDLFMIFFLFLHTPSILCSWHYLMVSIWKKRALSNLTFIWNFDQACFIINFKFNHTKMRARMLILKMLWLAFNINK